MQTDYIFLANLLVIAKKTDNKGLIDLVINQIETISPKLINTYLDSLIDFCIDIEKLECTNTVKSRCIEQLANYLQYGERKS